MKKVFLILAISLLPVLGWAYDDDVSQEKSEAELAFDRGMSEAMEGCCEIEPTPEFKSHKAFKELEVVDLKVGTGKEAIKGAFITTHFTMWLADGTELQSSRDNNEYFKVVLGIDKLIKGWEQGILGMKVGGKRRLYVPARLAYGKEEVKIDAYHKIPSNANLVFDIELFDVKTWE